jgi:hypothetical protein
VPKAVLQINHNKLLRFSVFPSGIWFTFSNWQDYLKFDGSSYELHRLRFLWKWFAFCPYEGWLVWFLGILYFHSNISKV